MSQVSCSVSIHSVNYELCRELIGIIHFPFVSSRYKGGMSQGEEEVGVSCKSKNKKEVVLLDNSGRSIRSFIVGQFPDQADAQYHDQEANCHYY